MNHIDIYIISIYSHLLEQNSQPFGPGWCRRCTEGLGDGDFKILRGKDDGTLLDFEVFPSFSNWQWNITHFGYGFPREFCIVIKYCDFYCQVWSTQKHLVIPDRTHQWSSQIFEANLYHLFLYGWFSHTHGLPHDHFVLPYLIVSKGMPHFCPDARLNPQIWSLHLTAGCSARPQWSQARAKLLPLALTSRRWTLERVSQLGRIKGFSRWF